MFGANKRPKRAVQRGVNHAHVSVISIIRQRPFKYVAEVEYTYGRGTWPEKITFDVSIRPGGRKAVRITDSDFPEDRAQEVVIDGSVHMPTFITSFIISGRW